MTWDATEFRQRVQDALDDFLDLQGQRMAPLGPDAERLLAEARAAVSGGKRFRAAFCWWGHLAVAPAADEQALYDVAPSFVALLPWVEYLPDSQCMLLEDGVSVAAFFELTPLGTEGREAAW